MIQNSVPRAAVINDISGFGRGSLTVVLPVLSSMKVQACPIPTAVLSTHTSGFTDYAFVDMTDFMKKCTAHWENLELTFDAVYTGFLGSADQMDIVSGFLAGLKKRGCRPLAVIDPVMGDDGEPYGPIGDDMIEKMRTFIRNADLITPNITEAAFLLNEKYSDNLNEKDILKWLPRLSAMGPDIVVITGVPEAQRSGTTSVIAYDKCDGRFWKVSCDFIPTHYPGTGDAFASVVVGSLLKGDSLPIALDRAVQFTTLAIRASFGHKSPAREGVLFESVLDTLCSPVIMSSYQLLDEMK